MVPCVWPAVLTPVERLLGLLLLPGSMGKNGVAKVEKVVLKLHAFAPRKPKYILEGFENPEIENIYL